MGSFINGLFQNLFNLMGGLFSWLGNLLWSVFQWLFNALYNLLYPVVSFFAGWVYFIAQVLQVVVLALRLVLGLVGVVFGVIGGFFNTIVGFLSWSGGAVTYPSAYQGGFSLVMNAIDQMGGDIFAGVLAVLVWILAVWVIFRVVSD